MSPGIASLYEAALNALPDPVVIVAQDGGVVAFNKASRCLVRQRGVTAEHHEVSLSVVDDENTRVL